MKRPLFLALALLALAPDARALTHVAYDPYASVSWTQDVRCKTAFHTHTDVLQSRIRAYDDAGYCAVAFHHYSGMPGHSSAWKQLHWPPESWVSPAFLASLHNIRVLIPDGEQAGWDHFTSPFLTTYLECYQDSTSRFPNSVCRQVGDPREAWHYSNETQLVDRIHQFGGLAAIAHNVGKPTYHLLDPLPADLMEICNGVAEYSDWQCDNTSTCNGWNDSPARIMLHYDDKLKLTPRTWNICVNDWHGPGVYNNWSPAGPAWINDSGHTLVLTPQVDLPTLEQRVRAGAMLAVQDRGVPKGTHPQVARIDVGSTTIHLEVTGYTSIIWIHNGIVVGALPDIDVSALAPGTIRAEIRDAAGSVVFTQPWELQTWVPRCSNGADDDGDGLVDFPNDPGCASALGEVEDPACDDGADNDSDGAVDLADAGCSSASDSSELAPPACSDGLDNDGDGFVDLADSGCDGALDDDEGTGQPACSNGLDDDGDGLADFPADPGCSDAASSVEDPACSNGLDDDGDLLVDLADPGCSGPADGSELTQPACANATDDDGDGLADYPADQGCASPASATEAPECNDGLDNDGDGLFDVADPDCSSPADPVEAFLATACSDGLDNDGDGRVDFPADPGCETSSSTVEDPLCDDDVDNDNDGKVDWDGGPSHGTPDPQCLGVPWRSERVSCGLGGELALLLPLLEKLRRRRA